MGSSTIGVVSMDQIPSRAAFMQSLKDSINELVNESYLAHGVNLAEKTQVPLIRNQARISDFSYNVMGDREMFTANFALFVSKDEFDPSSAHFRFKLNFGDPQSRAEGKDAIPNEGRILHIHPDSMDYKEAFEGPKMVLSLGNWGHSKEIVTRILEDFGAEYFFTQDDCSDEYERCQPNKEFA